MKRKIMIMILTFNIISILIMAPGIYRASELSQAQITFDASDQRYPYYSNDNSTIIYTDASYPNTFNYTIWAINVDGSNKSFITNATHFGRNGHGMLCLSDVYVAYTWSPGIEIKESFLILNTQTNETQSIYFGWNRSIDFFSISHDGNKAILFTSIFPPMNTANHYLIVLDLINKTVEYEWEHQISYHISHPAVFPNLSKIAWINNDHTGIVIFDLNTYSYSFMNDISSNLNSICISLDGSEILYGIQDDPNPSYPSSEIWAMSIDGNNKTFITNGTDPSYSHDGRMIVYSADVDGDGYYDIWTMEKPPLIIDTNGIPGFELILIIVSVLIANIAYGFRNK